MDKRLDYIDYFRGISILGVIAAHAYCWGYDWVYNTNWYVLGGTAYFFVFISGFIFQYKSHKFKFVEFFRKRFFGLFLPYIFIISPIALSYTIDNLPDLPFHSLDALHRFAAVFLGGFLVNPPIWFVVVIFVFFVLSPILLYLQRKHYWLFIVVMLASLVYTVVYPRASLILEDGFTYTGFRDLIELYSSLYTTNILHFIFFYIFGMWAYIMMDKYGDFIQKNIKKIALISFNLCVVHYAYSVDYLKDLVYKESSFSIVQIFLVLSLLIIYEDKIRQHVVLSKVLKFFSDYSFGIFLVHYTFVNLFLYHTLYQQSLPIGTLIYRNSFACFGMSILMFLFTLTCTVTLLVVAKKVLTFLHVKDTRKIIGV